MIRLVALACICAAVFGADSLEQIAAWFAISAVISLAFIADKLREPGFVARWWERRKLEAQYRLEQDQ